MYSNFLKKSFISVAKWLLCGANDMFKGRKCILYRAQTYRLEFMKDEGGIVKDEGLTLSSAKILEELYLIVEFNL